MTIQIDSRIGSRDLKPHIARGIRTQLTTLEYGDLAWIGNGPDDTPVYIGVERKRLKDYLNSIETGRLAGHQLIGMANAYHHSYIVVEGVWRVSPMGVLEVPHGRQKWGPLELGGRKFMAATVDNFSNSLSVLLNIPVIYTNSAKRTGSWVSNVYRWWTSKKWEQHRAVRSKSRVHSMPVSIVGKAPLMARVLMEFKGVGGDRALKLAEAFPTMWEFMMADKAKLLKVDGVGKKTVESIIEERGGV